MSNMQQHNEPAHTKFFENITAIRNHASRGVNVLSREMGVSEQSLVDFMLVNDIPVVRT